MKQRRPTIRIDDWKIALNLEDTKSVQRDEAAPAYNCGCDLCRKWKAIYKKLLPETYLGQLTRAFIDLDYPTELYESDSNKNGVSIRIQFHIVGKILDGPITYSHREDGRHMFYSEIRKDPWLTVALTKHSETYDYHPEYTDSKSGDIILVDMRLFLPHDVSK